MDRLVLGEEYSPELNPIDRQVLLRPASHPSDPIVGCRVGPRHQGMVTSWGHHAASQEKLNS